MVEVRLHHSHLRLHPPLVRPVCRPAHHPSILIPSVGPNYCQLEGTTMSIHKYTED